MGVCTLWTTPSWRFCRTRIEASNIIMQVMVWGGWPIHVLAHHTCFTLLYNQQFVTLKHHVWKSVIEIRQSDLETFWAKVRNFRYEWIADVGHCAVGCADVVSRVVVGAVLTKIFTHPWDLHLFMRKQINVSHLAQHSLIIFLQFSPQRSYFFILSVVFKENVWWWRNNHSDCL